MRALKIRAFTVTPIRLPLRRALETGSGRIEGRDGLLLRIETDGDLVGVGEAVAVPGFPTEDVAAARAALLEVGGGLLGSELPAEDALDADAPRARAWREALSRIGGGRPAARAALDTALLDLVARRLELRLADVLAMRTRAGVREEIEVNALVAGARVPNALLESATAVSAGHRTLKLKLPQEDPELASRCLGTVRAAVGAEVRLRADLNAHLDRATARAACRAFAEHDLEYVEQPVAADDVEGLAELRRAGDVPVAADESAATVAGARRVIEARAADVLVIKPSVLGGPRAALAVAAEARKAGIAVVVSSALEGRVGLAAALAVAAALPGARLASGLATAALLERDVVAGGLEPCEGRIALPEGDGLGVVPERDALEAVRAAPDARP